MASPLLVATSQSLLVLDPQSGKAKRLHSDRGVYYGIAYSPDRIYVAARDRLVSSPAPMCEEAGSILVFDYALELIEELRPPFPLRDLHQVLWHDDTLWVTCSHDNMVAVYRGGVWEEWFPDSGNSERVDINHFNSLYLDGSELLLLAHNLKQPSEIWHYALPERRLTHKTRLGRQGHNVWRRHGQCQVCSSSEGKIVSENGDVVVTGGFPRGVVMTEETAIVGVSDVVERRRRDFTTSKIMMFDGDWRFRQTVMLKGEGMIHDIKAPGIEDLANPHQLGQPLPVDLEWDRSFPVVKMSGWLRYEVFRWKSLLRLKQMWWHVYNRVYR